MLDKTQDESMPLTQPPEEEPDDFGAVAFDPESEDEGPVAPGGHDDSLLNLSKDSGALDVSGLNDSLLTQGTGGKRSLDTPTEPKKKRRRRRRKIVIDNDETELSNEHIKDMIANTEDLVKRQVHPAEIAPPQRQAWNPDFCRPFLADKGNLHPTLAKLWRSNFYRALEEECPFEKLESAQDVEAVRQQHEDDEDMSETGSQPPMTPGGGSGIEPQEEEPHDDFGAPGFDDEEEEEEEPDDFGAPAFDDEEEEGVAMEAQGRVACF